tara:strand:- start:551 stop:1186 length:636 start_codon:yes stop_codon:yes gene_type:complete
MAYPTYAVSTELDAVNQILSSVGQAPVTTLDQQNPEVAIALNTLRESNKQVQAEGWVFNTERHYEMTADAVTFEIKYPTNALQIDANRDQHFDDYDPIRREGKLYDRHTHSFEWKDGAGAARTIQVDVKWLFDFTEVPTAIQNYITARTAVMCAVKMVGDKELVALLNQQEINTRAAALEYETTQGGYSMFGWKDGENYHVGYQPYAALQR